MGKVDDLKVKKLSRGIKLDDGVTAPAKVQILGHNRLEFKIHEGRKRQIRRMCSKVGLEVVELKRIKMGSLSLGDLKPGEVKQLQKEVVEQKQATSTHN
jgi:23S rRNA pseudouridine2605 synthase